MEFWLAAVTQKLQIAVGGMRTIDLDHMRHALARAVAAIPAARTPVERQILRGFLWELAARCASCAHALLHPSSDPACTFQEQQLAVLSFVASTEDPRTIFQRWLPVFFQNLRQAHPISPAQRVARRLDAEFERRLPLSTLAAQVQMRPRPLQRAFRQAFGMTIREYHARRRILAALDAVVEGKSEAAALAVGYRSRKNFNRQFRQCTGLTPTQFRWLAIDRREAIATELRRSLGDFRRFRPQELTRSGHAR